MPFVRFSRDRRGYEHTYLIHAAPRRGAPTRILYWYRTPPGVKVGREAFDVEARRMLEAQYPSVPFDWSKLLETPMPPPEADNWRERRRIERSARQVRQAEEPEDAAVEPTETAEFVPTQPVPETAAATAAEVLVAEGSAGESEAPEGDNTATASRKRRRRGGRRRRRQDSPANTSSLAATTAATDLDPSALPPATGPETASPASSSQRSVDSPPDRDTKTLD